MSADRVIELRERVIGAFYSSDHGAFVRLVDEYATAVRVETGETVVESLHSLLDPRGGETKMPVDAIIEFVNERFTF